MVVYILFNQDRIVYLTRSPSKAYKKAVEFSSTSIEKHFLDDDCDTYKKVCYTQMDLEFFREEEV